MKKVLIVAVILIICNTRVFAQQNFFNSQEMRSAVVNSDNATTFRFIVPEAHEVQIVGDFWESCGIENISLKMLCSIYMNRTFFTLI